jgi:hypothetical protein
MVRQRVQVNRRRQVLIHDNRSNLFHGVARMLRESKNQANVFPVGSSALRPKFAN